MHKFPIKSDESTKRQKPDLHDSQVIKNKLSFLRATFSEVKRVLSNHSNIGILEISKGIFTYQGIIEMAELIRTNSTLTELSISSSALGDKETVVLAKSLSNNYTLKKINLSYNDIGVEGATEIANVLKNNSTLTILEIGGNQIQDEGTIQIAELLENNYSLTLIDLSSNDISDPGVISLMKALEHNSVLKDFNFSNNESGIAGAEAISQTLKINSSLTRLNISYNNQIQDKGGIQILKALKENSTLIDIDFTNCWLGDEFAAELGELLTVNTTLSRFNLSENRITKVGARKIADGLRKNFTLNQLELIHNKIEDEGAKKLLEAFSSHYALIVLNLQGNKADESTELFIKNIASKKKTLIKDAIDIAIKAIEQDKELNIKFNIDKLTICEVLKLGKLITLNKEIFINYISSLDKSYYPIELYVNTIFENLNIYQFKILGIVKNYSLSIKLNDQNFISFPEELLKCILKVTSAKDTLVTIKRSIIKENVKEFSQSSDLLVEKDSSTYNSYTTVDNGTNSPELVGAQMDIID